MSINKKNCVDYKAYLDELIQCGRRYSLVFPSKKKSECMTEIEQEELAGYIFRYEMANYPEDRGDILLNIFQQGGYYIADSIATFCITNSPDHQFELNNQIKSLVTAHYQEKMQELLNDRCAEISYEKQSQMKYEDNSCLTIY